ncbi:MAG TPA: hypothetical protein VLG67_01380 [Candidatus Saccharimonadales bacterium]|nr:hypothetical protein [Candidatus Saccharimonadales bacterium]
MLKKLLSLFAGIVLLSFAQTAYAVSPTVSIKLEQPKSPIGVDNFPINFVSLTTNGDSITVRCYKKSPTDGDFSQFGSDIVLSPGGNTDNCSVTSSVINQKGTYSFYATASDGENAVQSETVTVDFSDSVPDAPSNYSKDHPNSCQYVIKFKTANDSGKTVKVELYRSDNTTFNADSGTRVDSVSIGSNQDGQFTNNVPDCNKTFYYAIRAFNSAGNGSGLVGDSNITVTTTNSTTATTSQTGGAIAVGKSSQVGTSENGGANGTGGSGVLGNSTKSAEKGVKGASTENTNDKQNLTKSIFANKNILIALGLIALVTFAFFFYKRQKAK